MDDNVFRDFRCEFYERTEVDGGYFDYQRVDLHTPDGSGFLVTTQPPAVGDLVWLYSRIDGQARGMFRIVERAWRHPSYGSVHWPHVGGVNVGPDISFIVVAEAGLFVNEAPATDDE